MADIQGSRRAFVGATVAGAALLGPLAFLARPQRATTPGDAITFVPGVAPIPIYRPDPQEVDRWESAIGQQFRITGSEGATIATLDSVIRAPAEGERAAGLRQQPFTVLFSYDRRDAPAGDKIYDVDHAVDGLTRLFMQRGADRFDKAILAALFN